MEKKPQTSPAKWLQLPQPQLGVEKQFHASKALHLRAEAPRELWLQPPEALGGPDSFSTLCLLLIRFIKADSLRLVSVPRVRIPLLHSVCGFIPAKGYIQGKPPVSTLCATAGV